MGAGCRGPRRQRPSGRSVTLTGIEIYRVVDGQVVEMWGEADMSELFAAAEDTAAIPA